MNGRRYTKELFEEAGEAGIQARPLWQPLHCSPAYAQSLVVGGAVAERLNRQALSLPCSVGLDAADLDTIRQLLARR